MAETINFSGIYYKDILKALQRYRAKNLPELNDFSPYSTESQLERAIALVAHYLNVNIDVLAEELLVPTAKLDQSLINWALNVGYPLKAYTPSSVELVGRLVGHIYIPTVVVPKGYSITGRLQDGNCTYEAIENVELNDTTSCDVIYYSTRENKYLSAPSVYYAEDGDAVFFGFECMPTKFSFVTSSTLSGASVTIQYFDETYNKWFDVELEEESKHFSDYVTTVSIKLPQSLSSNWGKTTINGLERYFLRFSFSDVPDGYYIPAVKSVTVDKSGLYIKFTVYQGTSVSETFVSDGSENQMFNLGSAGLVEGSLDSITVNELGTDYTWTKVQSFAESKPDDRHYVVLINSKGNALVMLGNGIFGRIPPKGSVLKLDYRVIDTSVSGSLPPNGISGGATREVVSIYNLRRSTVSSSKLYDTEKLRNLLMGWIPSNSRVVTHSDLRNYVLNSYSSFVERVHTIESPEINQCYVVLVGQDGELCESSMISDISNKLNDKESGDFLVNQRCIVMNYEPVSFDVQAVVSTSGNVADIIENLITVYNPCYKDDDGNFLWNFNSAVMLSQIIATIQNTKGVSWVNLISPTTNVQLGRFGLPKLTRNNIKIRVSS